MQSSSGASPEYMAQQFDINERMRAILIDWLIEVGSNRRTSSLAFTCKSR